MCAEKEKIRLELKSDFRKFNVSIISSRKRWIKEEYKMKNKYLIILYVCFFGQAEKHFSLKGSRDGIADVGREGGVQGIRFVTWRVFGIWY